jgi:hypothetical protein
MGGQRDDRIEAPQRWSGAGTGSRMPLALGLQAQMRPRFFQRAFYAPATDQPGQDRLRCLVQVRRQHGLWLNTLAGIAHEPPAAQQGWLAGVRLHGAIGRHFDRAGGVARPPLKVQLAPHRVRVGQHGLQGRAPVAFQPGATELPRFTWRGRIIEGGIEAQPRDQSGSGPRADLMAQLPSGITAVRHNDPVASRPPAHYHGDDLLGSFDQSVMAAALRLIEALRGTQDRHQGPRPHAPGPWHRGQQQTTAPAQATHLHNMHVGGAHRITRDSFRAHVFAASALHGVVKTEDDDAPRHEHGH